jgi:hypothetical protein
MSVLIYPVPQVLYAVYRSIVAYYDILNTLPYDSFSNSISFLFILLYLIRLRYIFPIVT